MAAINSLLCSAQNPPFRPSHSSLVGRRALLGSPFMSVDNSAPPSSIPGLVVGTSLISSSNPQSSELSAGDRQSSSYASEKDAGHLNLSFSSLANAPTWTKLVVGGIAMLAMPFFGNLLRTYGMLKNVKQVEKMVETVAETVEKITTDIAKDLPNGVLKEEVLKLEKIASLVDKNAEALKRFIDKIDNAVEEGEIEPKANEGDEAKKNDAGDNTKTAGDHSHEKGVE